MAKDRREEWDNVTRGETSTGFPRGFEALKRNVNYEDLKQRKKKKERSNIKKNRNRNRNKYNVEFLPFFCLNHFFFPDL